MAVLTAQGISRVALALLYRTLVLPRTATMIPGEEFAGSNGDTITVRVRQARTARTQANPSDLVTLDDIAEVGIDVQVKHLYDGTNVTDEQLTLEIESFADQVLAPLVGSVATGAELQLATVMNALTVDSTIEFASSATEADTIGVVLAAREQLSENEVPIGGRFLAVAPNIATRLLSLEQLNKVDNAGSPSALRDAIVGRLFGFTVVESAALTAGTAVAYHSSGFAWANRSPVAPRGANESAVTTSDGVSMRTIFDYDADHLRDRVIVSTFAGAAAVYEDESETDNQRFIKIGTST